MSVLAVLVGLTTSAPARAVEGARAAEEIRSVTRDGFVLQLYRVPVTASPMTGAGATRSDFDGDGVDDIAAAAVPHYRIDLPESSAGIVVVHYSSAPQVDYLTGSALSGSGCCFGTPVVAGDFDGDGYDDLAIGDPDEVDRGNRAEGGGVWIIPGSPSGLVLDSASHVNQSSPGVPGESETKDWFGGALAAGDLNGDGRDDLAIGAYGEAIGSKTEAGAVTVLFGSPTGITTTGAQDIHQDQAAVPGGSERNDMFGFGLAIGRVNNDRYADLAIASPNENDEPNGSGAVALIWGSAGGMSTTGATSVTGVDLYQGMPEAGTTVRRLGEALAIGDVNGDGLGEVIAGAPSSTTPNVTGGLVVAFTGRSGGLSRDAVRVVTQRTSGVPGEPEGGDWFGARLAVGDVTGDGRADVLVGTPGEALGSATGAGVVTLLKGSAAGLTGTGAQSFDQNDPIVPGGAEAGDRFGGSVALLNLDGVGGLDALVAAPGEEVNGDDAGWGSGSTYRFHGSGGGLVPQPTSTNGAGLRTDRIWPQQYGLHLVGAQGGHTPY
ncbi:hypothetical protein [Plantactinospora sp. B5E13]|uniref:hypothetical protein n=1 Tax=unclassified Plantactinospora TaxID=2631981 RepID=UPI00325F494B